MSTQGPCENATSPIDITTPNQSCTTICDYKFKYALSDCVLINQGDYLEIKTSSIGNTISFNNSPYTVKETRLYQPSLHTFNGSHLTGELIIHHIGGGHNLLVCIPVTTSNGKSKSVNFFDAFLPYAPQNQGTTTNVNVTNWSLNSVIPTGGYYFYQATAPFPPCTGVFNFIVFGKSIAAQVSQDALSHLTSVIKKNTLQARKAPDGGLYYNSRGTLDDGGGGSDIYIDCKPVGQECIDDGDEGNGGDFELPKTLTLPPLNELINNPIFSVVMGVALLIVLKKLYNVILGKIS
jgi:carbonic anhydrase